MSASPQGSSSESSDTVGALPRWARAADILAVLLVALAAIVAEWGGFRARFGDYRVALTSPYRLLLQALVLLVVRHVLAPAPRIYTDLPRRIWHGLTSAPARAGMVGALGTRPAILFVGYFAFAGFGYVHERPPVRFSEDEVINLQGRWDASWYMDIATEGYRYQAGDSKAQQNIVFFPVFPMALRIVGRLFGGSVAAHLFAGTLLNWTLFFVALCYLFRLARELFEDDEVALSAVLLLAAYPFAVFYGAIYAESFYLLGAVAAFYHGRRGEFVKTAAWGLMVGLTRPNGCFLSIPLVLVTTAPWMPRWLHAPWRTSSGGDAGPGGDVVRPPFSRFVAAVGAAAAPGIGVLIFCAFVWSMTGDPLTWAEGHAAWGREYVGFGKLISTWYRYFDDSGWQTVTRVLPYDSLNALGALFVLALTVPVLLRLGLPYAVFILVNMLPPMAAGGFLSTGRLSSVIFPAFLWLAAVVPPRQRGGWVSSFMAVQALCAAMFYTWRELF